MGKRKILSILLVLTLTAGIMTGCAGSGKKEENNAAGTETGSAASFVKEDGSYDLDAAFAAESGKGDPIRVISTFEGTCQVQSQIAYLLGFYEAEGLKEGVQEKSEGDAENQKPTYRAREGSDFEIWDKRIWTEHLALYGSNCCDGDYVDYFVCDNCGERDFE